MVVQLPGDTDRSTVIDPATHGSTVFDKGSTQGEDVPPFAQRALAQPLQGLDQPSPAATGVPRSLIGLVAASVIGLLVVAAAASRSTDDSTAESTGPTISVAELSSQVQSEPSSESSNATVNPPSLAAGDTQRASGTWMAGENADPADLSEGSVDPADQIFASPFPTSTLEAPSTTRPTTTATSTTATSTTATSAAPATEPPTTLISTTQTSTTQTTTTVLTTTTTSLPPPVNLLANPSFEADAIADNDVQVLPVSGWASSWAGNLLEVWGTGFRGVVPSNGRQLVELNGDGPDSISQTVRVVPGQQYRWTFDHQGRADVDSVEVLVNGESQGRFSAQPGGWSTHSGVVTVNTAKATVALRALDSGSIGNFVDNVRFIRTD